MMTQTRAAYLIAMIAQMDARQGYGGQIAAAVSILKMGRHVQATQAGKWASLIISGMFAEAAQVAL